MPALPWDVCALVLGCMRATWDACAALGCMLYLSLFLANAEKSDLIVLESFCSLTGQHELIRYYHLSNQLIYEHYI
jgi:hypothetical protein